MPKQTRTLCHLLIPWFGPWPIYFPAFLVTCAPNTRFEWLILSDTPSPPAHPPNVRFAHLTLTDFNFRLKQHCRLDFAVPEDAIYKICDLRWPYGQMFADQLCDVPHWAICDIDQLWGNILGHLTEDLFRTHHILTTRHFKALLKQKPAKNWWKRVLAPRHPRIYCEKVLVNYGDDHLAMRDDQYIEWRNGRTYIAEGQELIYLHFHRLKATIRSCNFTYGDNPRRICLSRYEILGN